MPVRLPIRTPIIVAVLLASAALAAPRSWADEAIDRLRDRVPDDAALVLEVERLGDRLRDLIGSPVGGRLADSRAVRDWLDSDEGAALRRARRDVERALGAPLVEAVDGLLGSAVVLSLHLPDGAAPEEARGLLQTSVGDPDLLRRFIGVANLTEGAALRVGARSHGGVSYSVRSFNDGRPAEAYALLDDGTFAWTNAERLLIEVIDRLADPGRASWADRPGSARVRSALPDGAFARLFVDPGALARLAEADPAAPALDDLPAPVAASIRAIEAIGAAVEWRDGPVLHVVEAIDPDRLPDPVRSWASRAGGAGAPLGVLPASALLAASGRVDLPALHDLIVASVPEAARPRVEALDEVARGLLLGRDPRSAILPAIGPGLVAWIDAPHADRPLRAAPAVLVASVGDPEVAEAIDNALRTLLAFITLDEDREPPLRLAVETRGGARVSALASGDGTGASRFAFAVARGLIVLGTDADAVAAVFDDPGAPADAPDAAHSRPRPAALVARDRLFPDATTFAYLDLDALSRIAADRRAELAELLDAEPEDDDLARLLDLLSLFRGAYATSTLAEDGSLAHHRLGLVVPGPDDSPASQ